MKCMNQERVDNGEICPYHHDGECDLGPFYPRDYPGSLKIEWQCHFDMKDARARREPRGLFDFF